MKGRKKTMKKIISLILVLAALFTTLITPTQAAQPDEISPRYVTAEDATTRLSIDSAGNVTVSVSLFGDFDVTEVSVTTYLEQKIGNTWYRARVNPWTYSTSNSYCTAIFSGHISNSGTYRARSTFTVTGSTVETIIVIGECTY